MSSSVRYLTIVDPSAHPYFSTRCIPISYIRCTRTSRYIVRIRWYVVYGTMVLFNLRRGVQPLNIGNLEGRFINGGVWKITPVHSTSSSDSATEDEVGCMISRDGSINSHLKVTGSFIRSRSAIGVHAQQVESITLVAGLAQLQIQGV